MSFKLDLAAKTTTGLASTWLVAMLVVGLAGCSDTSKRAPLPDYSNMTDGGAENTQSEE